MAGSADDCALGAPGPRGGRGQRGRKASRVRGHVANAAQPDRLVREPAARIARQALVAEQSARNRARFGVNSSTARQFAAEAIGTALLVATVVGSGIMAERLAGGNTALALLGNTLSTGCILIVLILVFGPISGAHFNPAVSIV